MKLFNRKNEIAIKSDVPSIAVRDLKEYLVRDFEQIKDNEQVIERLKEKVEELTEIEIKYKATLITLEEYDTRVLREKEKVTKLEKKLDEKQARIKELLEEKNNCLIREKQAMDKIKNTQKYVEKEIKDEIIDKINNTKGNISKKKIIELISR